jgi:hypothetical protein
MCRAAYRSGQRLGIKTIPAEIIELQPAPMRFGPTGIAAA